MLFGDAVAGERGGQYLWHRKMLRPLLWHTWACHLSTLTCGTFSAGASSTNVEFFSTRAGASWAMGTG